MALSITMRAATLGAFSAHIDRARREQKDQMIAFMRRELGAAKRAMEQATWQHTGNTAHRWRVELVNERQMRLVNDSPIISFQFTGTRPHNIPGAFGYRLPFGIGGRFRGMFHPGTKQNRALVAAMDSESKRIRGAFAAFGARLAITYARSTLPHGDGA